MARRARRRNPITADDLSEYGSVSDGDVDVDRAARGLGASKTSVRQALRQARKSLTNTVFQRLSGRKDADSSKGDDVRGMLQAAFGRGPRGGAVNAADAAKRLGVSPGTVRRWAAGTQQPAAQTLSRIRTAARRASSTKRGRRNATKDFRTSVAGARALRTGSKLWISGQQGVGGYSQGYARDRRVAVDINPDDVGALLAAYEENGDAGVREWMKSFLDTNYVAGWDFVTIDDFGFGNP
ncbi:helix-turn-helix transcriptional regulator [Mycobacterium sp.]|uniref:helix-turn-helix transcriptional regulator n=1 Tax=Mycobacterium sp. TaxID=1785 RepID=UPI002600363C|nr:helix-turn-helix transcriptional regulator [Mycobacterium sp.]